MQRSVAKIASFRSVPSEASLPHLRTGRKVALGFQQVVNKLAGGELSVGAEVKLPEKLAADWKRLLEALCRDLCEPDAKKRRTVVAFDELPLIFAKQAVVHEDADELIADRFVQERRDDG